MADINAFDSPVSIVTQDQPAAGVTAADVLSAIPLAAVGAADNVVSSLTFGKLSPTLVSETLLNNSVGEATGLYNRYKQNEDGYKLAGDLATLMIGAGAAMHAARGRGLLQAGGRASGFIKDATAAGEFGGYIASEGSLAANAVKFGGQENLDILRHMFKLKDAEYGAAGVKNLGDVAARRSALSNIARTGTLGAIDEAITAEAATLLLLNQSNTLFPEGMTAKEYLLTSTAFAGLGVAGSLGRTFYSARASAREAGLLAGTADVAAATPTAAMDAAGSFRLSAQFDELGAVRTLYNEGGHDTAVQSAALSKKVRIEENIFNELKLQSEKPSDWTGTKRALSREQIETLREHSDGSAMRGIRGIRQSDELLFDLSGRKATALANVNKEIAELKAKTNFTGFDQERLAALEAKELDIATANFTHVMSDGTHMAHGDAPIHIGWFDNYSGRVNDKFGDKPTWRAGRANTGGTDVAIHVSPDFTSTLAKPNRAPLVDVTKQALAYSQMLSDDAFKTALNGVEKIDIAKLSRDPVALQAILGYSGQLREQELQQFLGKLKLPEGVQDMQGLRDWALSERIDTALEFLQDNAKQRRRLRKSVVEQTTPYELSLRTGLQFHDDKGVGTPLFDMLQGMLAAKSHHIPTTLRNEEAIRALMANAGAVGRTTNPDVIARAAGQPIEFNLMTYKWKQKPVALVTSGAERDAQAGLDARTLLKAEQELRLERLDRAETIVSGGNLEDPRLNTTLVQALNDEIGRFGQDVRDRLEIAAAGVIQGQQRGGPFWQAFLSRSFQMEEVLGGSLAKSVSDAIRKVKDDYAIKHFGPIQNIAQQLNKLENKADQISMNSYLRAMSLKIPVKEGIDAEGRVLVETENEVAVKIFKNLFGIELKPGSTAYLPNPVAAAKGEYVPLRITEGARPMVDALTSLAKADLLNRNQLRYANKQALIRNRAHYLPHVDYDGAHYRYIMNEHGRPVAMVAGVSHEAAQAEANAVLQELAAQNKASRYAIASNEDIVAYKRAHGEQAFDTLSWADRSQAKGAVSNLLKLPDDNSLLEAYMRAYSASLDAITRDTMRTQFKEALGALHFNASVAKPNSFIVDAKGNSVRRLDDAFSLFEEAMLGTKTAKPGAWTSDLEALTEKLIEPSFERVSDFLRDVTKPVQRVWEQLRGRAPKPGEFAELGKKLEAETGYAPFTNAMEYAAVTTGYKPTKQLRDTLQAANGHAAYMILGLDPLNGLVNAISPFAMGPAHMRLFKRIKGESDAMHQFRIGDIGHVAGGEIMPNQFGLAIQGLKNVFDPEFRRYYDRFVEKPAHDGNVFTLLRDVKRTPEEMQSLWHKAFNGETGAATFLSRRGDTFAQEFSHSIAYTALKRSGLPVNDGLIQAYANYMGRKINTQMPHHDKADFFQTTAGMPFGLFQSFANNYLQNLAQMIERGDARATFTQYAFQGMLFGMSSVPGWQQMNDHVFRSWDGESDLNTNLLRSLGRANYDIVMNGPVWSVPKIFGADGLGIYTRGDANIRPSIGQVSHITDLPALSAIGGLFSSLAAGFNVAKSAGGDPAAWEALIRSVPTRPIRGALEVWQGYATDKYGQQTFDRTQDWGASLLRFAGAKTMTEIEAAKLSWHLKGVDQAHKAEIGKLRIEAQAIFRSGDYARFGDMAERYVKAGGNPASFTRWFNDTAKISREVRSDRELQKAIEKSESFRNTIMLMDTMTNR